MKRNFMFCKMCMLGASILLMSECQSKEPDKPTNETPWSDTSTVVDPSRWSAVNDNGLKVDPATYRSAREGKKVGIFYFIWMGCHGYDTHSDNNQVVLPKATDTKSPYDNSKLLAANPNAPAFGPVHAFHHWGEPYFGYYLSNDSWVIRRHAQMLCDAGVDFVALDVTNALTYIPVVRNLCSTYQQIRKAGGRTPQITFVLNSSASAVLNTLYAQLYRTGQYDELWFRWLDKPLMLASETEATDAQKAYFTLRQCWFDTNSPWFTSTGGRDKWSWGDYYPQKAGWHTSASEPEAISILPATHPHNNLGRSHYNGQQPVSPTVETSGKGLYFSQQIERALQVDPQITFITGWNEWVAMRFTAAELGVGSFVGKPVSGNMSVFVDQYNMEYSRDLEPMRGGFGDNYYYQMVDFVRRFKGVSKDEKFTAQHTIKIDGLMQEWRDVEAAYADDPDDIRSRNAVGYGRVGTYVNATGRNDIILTKVASDAKNIYFFVRCNNKITSPSTAWMQLFIDTNSGSNTWNGFSYAVNRTKPTASTAVLERCTGGWAWESRAQIEYAVNGNDMELSIPLSELGITSSSNFSIDFKWVDNACKDGDIQTCMTDGDSAPDSRFKYRYSFDAVNIR